MGPYAQGCRENARPGILHEDLIGQWIALHSEPLESHCGVGGESESRNAVLIKSVCVVVENDPHVSDIGFAPIIFSFYDK